jgi:hypothetical protein
MKDEMELVQEMENVDERDTETYVNRLQAILNVKSHALQSLRCELENFLCFQR